MAEPDFLKYFRPLGSDYFGMMLCLKCDDKLYVERDDLLDFYRTARKHWIEAKHHVSV